MLPVLVGNRFVHNNCWTLNISSTYLQQADFEGAGVAVNSDLYPFAPFIVYKIASLLTSARYVNIVINFENLNV